MSKLKPGDYAPDISLPDQDGTARSLAGLRGQWVILYFYPKDLTPGCTVEACAFRDEHEAFEAEGIAVLGVSADDVRRHATFASKHRLPFPLLADEEKRIVKAYGVWGKKKFMGREYMGINRWSFLIDPKGRIRKIYDAVKPAGHAAEVLADVRAFKEAQ